MQMLITDEQRDMLCELINIGVGHAASTLNSLIEHKIKLSVPSILIIDASHPEELPESLQMGEATAVTMAFHGDLKGNSALMFPPESASTLVSALTGEAPDSPMHEELRAGTLAEVGNILLNGVLGSLSNMLDTTLSFTVPHYEDVSLDQMIVRQSAEAILIAQAQFLVDELMIEGNVVLFFEVSSFDALVAAMERMLSA